MKVLPITLMESVIRYQILESLKFVNWEVEKNQGLKVTIFFLSNASSYFLRTLSLKFSLKILKQETGTIWCMLRKIVMWRWIEGQSLKDGEQLGGGYNNSSETLE